MSLWISFFSDASGDYDLYVMPFGDDWLQTAKLSAVLKNGRLGPNQQPVQPSSELPRRRLPRDPAEMRAELERGLTRKHG